MALSQDDGNVRNDRAYPMRLRRVGLVMRYANRSDKLGGAVGLLVLPAPVCLMLALGLAFGPDPKVWVACVLGLTGISIVAVALAQLVRAVREIRHFLRLLAHGAPSLARITEAKVVTVERKVPTPVVDRWLDLIAFTFQTAAGEVVNVERGMPPVAHDRLHVGDRVLVLYDPVNPSDNVIDYFDARQADRLQIEAEEASTAGRSPQHAASEAIQASTEDRNRFRK
jgi:hypothetical protein